MATDESKRVMEIKRKNYEQTNFLAPKGFKVLLRALGRKEKCSAAEIIRRSVLLHAGLENMPEDKMLNLFDKALTSADVTDMLLANQTIEYLKKQMVDRGHDYDPQLKPPDKWFNTESTNALLNVLKELKDNKQKQISITKHDYLSICRLLSSAKIADNNIL